MVGNFARDCHGGYGNGPPNGIGRSYERARVANDRCHDNACKMAGVGLRECGGLDLPLPLAP